MNAIDYKIEGIKCDNPDCDYKNGTVDFKDYPLWLNKPCPKCGWNLLTQEDLDTTNALIEIVDTINRITEPFTTLFENSKRIRVSAEMNGTGTVNFKRLD